MSFISYAQNFEDVMLWRALGHIKNGFYIDIGAQHPINDSVSKAFYEHGWRGVHVEPVPEFADLLRKDRPDETVLQVALGDSEGILELNVIAETGLSTAVNGYAERHRSERGFTPQKLHVPVLTLKSAFSAYFGKEIHWLKIDVEGFEEKVLRGWNSEMLRPWVMIVEATIPNSTELNYSGWERILLDADYQFVYFDGLNRFYVAKEHAELAQSFSSPPNVFDQFQLSGCSSGVLCNLVKSQYESGLIAKEAEMMALMAQQRSLTQNLAMAEQHLKEKQAENEDLLERSQWLENEWKASQAHIHHLTSGLRSRTEELEQMLTSSSWRVTAPFRRLATLGKSVSALPGNLLRSTARAVMPVVRPVALMAIRKVLTNPAMTKKTLAMLNKVPTVKQKLRRSAVYAGLINEQRREIYTGTHSEMQKGEGDRSSISIPHQQDLSARANRILIDLQKANKARR